jgi:hypothetical protein
LLCLIAGILVFKSVSPSSSRIVLKDQAKIEKIILHNAKGDHACHCFPPMISTNPGFQIIQKDITESSASFRWVCDKPASYQVNYGTSSSKGTLFPSTRPTTYYTDYTVKVTGLKPNTTYHAGPYAQAQTGGYPVKKWLMQNTAQSDWTFTTLAAAATTYSIGGSILDSKGAGINGVKVALSGDTTYTVTTPSTGIYEFTSLKQGKNYKVTPTKDQYKFTPEDKSYTALAANQTAQNYVGELITSVKRNRNEESLITFNVKATKMTTTDATITWTTNLLSTSEVEYGQTTQYGLKSGENSESVTDHYIQLFDLKPGTTYHFRTISKTGSEVSFKSEDFTLTTEAVEKRIVDKNDIFVEPNPCANDVVFNYRLFKPVNNVTIDIFSLSGKKVAVLESPSTALDIGWNRISWQVHDQSGRPLINGLYVYRMRFIKDGIEEVSERSQFMVRR